MANKLIGILFILIGAASGLLFCGPIFMHGFNEGLYRLENIHMEQGILAMGALFFFGVGVSYLFKKKKPPLSQDTK